MSHEQVQALSAHDERTPAEVETSELGTSLSALVSGIGVLAAQDQGFRAALRKLCQGLQGFLERCAPPVQPVQTETTPVTAVEVTPVAAAPPADVPAQDAGIREDDVTAATPVSSVSVTVARGLDLGADHQVDPDPVLIATRCQVKAEGARWAVERRKLIAAGADFRGDVAPGDRQIGDKARSTPDCFLWTNRPTTPVPQEPAAFLTLADCFEVLAAAIGFAEEVAQDDTAHQEMVAESLQLLAEAQSALRAAMMAAGGPNDYDQLAAFEWLRARAAEKQIFIPRYMRETDPASPDNWSSLKERIDAAQKQWQEHCNRLRRRKQLFGKIKYETSRLVDTGDADFEGRWKTLITACAELVGLGVPPSNRELRELLLPVLDDMPSLPEVPPQFALVVREVDRFLAGQQSEELPSRDVEPTEEIKKVAKKLRKRILVLIGGNRRRCAEAALKSAFGLKELFWIETRPHQTVYDFEPYVARPDVAAVLLLIRWVSHGHGDVAKFCTKYDRPLIRLPWGYNPNQVAARILEHRPDWSRDDDVRTGDDADGGPTEN